MFEHQDTIGSSQSDRSTGAAFADNYCDQGHLEFEALLGRTGNGLRLAALFGLDSREGARRVDQSDDRQSEPVGQLHQSDRFAITLGFGHPEIVLEAGSRVVALFVT